MLAGQIRARTGLQDDSQRVREAGGGRRERWHDAGKSTGATQSWRVTRKEQARRTSAAMHADLVEEESRRTNLLAALDAEAQEEEE
jgi:hypothetical protein